MPISVVVRKEVKGLTEIKNLQVLEFRFRFSIFVKNKTIRFVKTKPSRSSSPPYPKSLDIFPIPARNTGKPVVN